MDRLEQKGLVQRVPDPDDRRVTRVTLTAAGWQISKPARDLAHKHLGVLEEALSDAELELLTGLLEKIYRRQAGEAAEATLAALREETH
ncbi:MAG: MarR family winged helix-turn-helix transcriptional regulator [Patescibacteria group bacterium]